jgi:hypothetical protein
LPILTHILLEGRKKDTVSLQGHLEQEERQSRKEFNPRSNSGPSIDAQIFILEIMVIFFFR